MPRKIPLNLAIEKNKTEGPSPWIILLEIVLKDLANPATTTTYRLCNNQEDVDYDSNTYTAFPFSIEPNKTTAKGRINTIDLKISNVTRLMQQTLEAYDGGLDSTVKMTIVSNANLAENYAELEFDFTIVTVKANAHFVTVVLGAANPLRQLYPLYRYLSNHCRYVVHYKGAECQATSALATCDGTLDNCVTRANVQRFGGFPGVKAGGIQIAKS